MSNPDYSQNKPTPKKVQRPAKRASAPSPGFPEKPAFPTAALPGKTQPRDRSAGMGRKARIHPKSIGLG